MLPLMAKGMDRQTLKLKQCLDWIIELIQYLMMPMGKKISFLAQTKEKNAKKMIAS